MEWKPASKHTDLALIFLLDLPFDYKGKPDGKKSVEMIHIMREQNRESWMENMRSQRKIASLAGFCKTTLNLFLVGDMGLLKCHEVSRSVAFFSALC
jgi:hypothetical protein